MSHETTPAARGPAWRAHALGIAASAALAGGFAVAQGPSWVLGFVVLVPWLLVLDRAARRRHVLASSVVMSMAFSAAVFPWFGLAMGAYTGMGAVTATTALLVLAPLMQAQFLAFALVRHAVGPLHGPALRALAGAAAWVGCEALVGKLLGDTLGHGLFPSAVLRQAADLGGAAGLTVLLLLVNDAMAQALRRRGDGRRAWLPPLGAGAAIVAAMAAYGTLRLHLLSPTPGDEAPTLRVAMVQAAITDYERRRREDGAYAVVRHVLDTHYALSASALRDHGADALLWSETVYPTTFGRPRSADGAALDAEIRGFVDHVGVPLLFGTYDRDDAGEYNAAALVEPKLGTRAVYRKTHPFPLTEHVPAWLDGPTLRRWLPWTGAWRAGDGARVLPLRTRDGREVQVLPLICLDDVHPRLAVEGARLGAQAILGMSNDAWFTDHGAGARLHLAVAAFRSVETRLPQLRVTTNGLSAVIDDTGEVLVQTAMGQQAVLTGVIRARDPAPSLMVRWGDWVGRAGIAFLASLALYAAWRSAHRRRLARGAHESATSSAAGPGFTATRMPRAVRASITALRLVALAGLAGLAIDMATRIGWQVATLAQLQAYALVVLLPLGVAALIGRWQRAAVSLQGDTLVIDGRRQRVDIPRERIARLEAWTVPAPWPGADVVLEDGRRWSLATRDVTALASLAAALRGDAPAPTAFARWAHPARHRALAHRPRLDHPLLKFGLFPLLPALVAFRLHQVIAFGGTFGEWLTYGPAAWFAGLALWWGAWSLGLMLLAAALRLALELVNLGVAALASDVAAEAARDASEWLARLAYYVAVPAWLGLRLLGG